MPSGVNVVPVGRGGGGRRIVDGGGGSGRPVIGPVAVDDVVALAVAVVVGGEVSAVGAEVVVAAVVVVGGSGAGSTFAALAVASTFALAVAEGFVDEVESDVNRNAAAAAPSTTMVTPAAIAILAPLPFDGAGAATGASTGSGR
jgi:hypothetical protein